jgi:membrane protein
LKGGPIKKLIDVLGFLRFVLRRWSEDRCPQIAGSLTYTTLLAIVPVFAIAVALVAGTPLFGDLMAEIKAFLLANLVPEIAKKVIAEYMGGFAANARRLTTLGIAAVFFVAVMLMLIVDRSLNVIWRVRRSRPYWLSVLGYMALLVTGPVLIAASVSVTTYLMTLSIGLAPVPAQWHPVLFRSVPLAMSALAFFLVYKIVPHHHVPWRHALVGSLSAALLFEAAKELFGVYVRYARTYDLVYGAFAAVPFFLIWIYLSWLVILFGAELTASAAYWRDRLWRRAASPGSHFHNAVAIARALLEPGAALTHGELGAATALPPHELEAALLHMVDADIVERGRGSRYRFARDPATVTLAELYEATVAPVGGLSPDDWADVAPDFARAAAEMREGLRRPLTALRRA